MFNALNGMGGGGQEDPKVANDGLTALYACFAVFGVVGGGIYNVLGGRFTLVVGSSAYVLYVGSYLSYNHTSDPTREGLVVSAGAVLGAGAGLLWAAQGAIVTSYPSPARKGLCFSLFWAIFNSGGVLGALIPLALNFRSDDRDDDEVSSSRRVSDATYIAFMAVMSLGTLLSLALASPDRVLRDDGTRVVSVSAETIEPRSSPSSSSKSSSKSPSESSNSPSESSNSSSESSRTSNSSSRPSNSAPKSSKSSIRLLGSELVRESRLVLRLLADHRALGLLALPSFASNFFYAYQFNGVNAALFDVRTRAFNSAFYWALQMAGSAAMGWILDKSRPPSDRAARGRIGCAAMAVLTIAVWGGGLASQLRESDSDSDSDSAENKQNLLDFTLGRPFLGPFALFAAFGVVDAMFQTLCYWAISGMASGDDPAQLSRYCGFYKGVQSAGAAVAWHLGNAGISYLVQLLVSWSLMAASLPLLAILVSSSPSPSPSPSPSLADDDEKRDADSLALAIAMN
jgi:hypothetical protein